MFSQTWLEPDIREFNLPKFVLKQLSPSCAEIRGEYDQRQENTVCGTALSGKQLQISGGAIICKVTRQ